MCATAGAPPPGGGGAEGVVGSPRVCPGARSPGRAGFLGCPPEVVGFPLSYVPWCGVGVPPFSRPCPPLGCRGAPLHAVGVPPQLCAPKCYRGYPNPRDVPPDVIGVTHTPRMCPPALCPHKLWGCPSPSPVPPQVIGVAQTPQFVPLHVIGLPTHPHPGMCPPAPCRAAPRWGPTGVWEAGAGPSREAVPSQGCCSQRGEETPPWPL